MIRIVNFPFNVYAQKQELVPFSFMYDLCKLLNMKYLKWPGGVLPLLFSDLTRSAHTGRFFCVLPYLG